MLPFDTFAHRVAKLCQRFQPERLGKIVVDSDRAWRFDLLHRDGENRLFARECGHTIILGKFDIHGAALAGFNSEQLLLKARNELTRADLQRHVIARTAVKRRALDRALKGKRDAVALPRRRIAAVVERTALLGDRLQGLTDLGILDWSREPLELDGLEIGKRDRRHDLHFDGVSEICLSGDDALDGTFFRQDMAVPGHDGKRGVRPGRSQPGRGHRW